MEEGASAKTLIWSKPERGHPVRLVRGRSRPPVTANETYAAQTDEMERRVFNTLK